VTPPPPTPPLRGGGPGAGRAAAGRVPHDPAAVRGGQAGSCRRAGRPAPDRGRGRRGGGGGPGSAHAGAAGLALEEVLEERDGGRLALTEVGACLRSDVAGSMRGPVVAPGGSSTTRRRPGCWRPCATGDGLRAGLRGPVLRLPGPAPGAGGGVPGVDERAGRAGGRGRGRRLRLLPARAAGRRRRRPRDPARGGAAGGPGAAGGAGGPAGGGGAGPPAAGGRGGRRALRAGRRRLLRLRPGRG
jgi:translation initiation factor IF-2